MNQSTETVQPGRNDQPAPSDNGASKTGKTLWRGLRTGIPIAAVVCAAAISAACCLYCANAASAPSYEEPAHVLSAETPLPAAHQHDWTIDYETVHHDAVTHEEVVQPVYESITTYHSVCNDCEEIIDGHAAEHIELTAHSGYSTNVPVEESRKVADGRIDVIEDSPEYDELVAVGRTCTVCGAES